MEIFTISSMKNLPLNIKPFPGYHYEQIKSSTTSNQSFHSRRSNYTSILLDLEGFLKENRSSLPPQQRLRPLHIPHDGINSLGNNSIVPQKMCNKYRRASGGYTCCTWSYKKAFFSSLLHFCTKSSDQKILQSSKQKQSHTRRKKLMNKNKEHVCLSFEVNEKNK